jgi:hypothetical protein
VCSVFAYDTLTKRDVPVTVTFELWSAGEKVRSLRGSPYRPNFWTTQIAFGAAQANQSFTVIAHVIGRMFNRTYSYAIRVNSKTEVVGPPRASARGLHASVTSSGRFTRPERITIGALAQPTTQTVRLVWTMACTRAGLTSTRHGVQNDTDGSPVVLLAPSIAEAESCSVTATATLGATGTILLDLLATVYR